MVLPNKDIVGKRFFKKKETYRTEAQVQKRVSKELLKTIISHSAHYTSLLEVGCGVGFLTKKLLKNTQINTYYANDISYQIEQDIQNIAKQFSHKSFNFLPGDAESIDFPEQLQAIVSSSTIQWFHDIPSFIVKAYNSIEKGGLFAFSTFGPQNYSEIKNITGLGLRYLTLAQLIALLKPYFSIQYSKEWTEQLHFDSPQKVLKHIQATGVNSTNQEYFGKEQLQHFYRKYQQLYSVNSQVHLTYHPIIIIAQKK